MHTGQKYNCLQRKLSIAVDRKRSFKMTCYKNMTDWKCPHRNHKRICVLFLNTQNFGLFQLMFESNMDKLSRWVYKINLKILTNSWVGPYSTQASVETTQHFFRVNVDKN